MIYYEKQCYHENEINNCINSHMVMIVSRAHVDKRTLETSRCERLDAQVTSPDDAEYWQIAPERLDAHHSTMPNAGRRYRPKKKPIWRCWQQEDMCGHGSLKRFRSVRAELSLSFVARGNGGHHGDVLC